MLVKNTNMGEGSLPEFLPFESNTGFINALTESVEINTLKRFSMFEKVEDKIEYHFAIQTAFKFDSLKAAQFLQSNLKIVDVDYRDCLNKIATYSLYDVLDNKISQERVVGKIILFGFLGPGDKDKILLPLKNENLSKTDIYGLEYLACIIIQVIGGRK
jgi:CHASE2 domain-containing sensor protein